MGRNKSRYIDKADKKKLKDKSTVLSTTGHDIGRGTILKDSSSYTDARAAHCELLTDRSRQLGLRVRQRDREVFRQGSQGVGRPRRGGEAQVLRRRALPV